jgi:hypothetical protein
MDGGSPLDGRRSINEASEEASLLLIDDDHPPRSKNQAAENIYEAYPRKTGRATAIKAILRAMKTHDPAFLLERTKAYAGAIHWQDRQFIPHPATWFNGERFNDDPKEWDDPKKSAKTTTGSRNLNSNEVGI